MALRRPANPAGCCQDAIPPHPSPGSRAWTPAAVDSLLADIDAGRYPPDTSDPRRAAATLADFLTTRSGIDWAAPGQTYDDETHPTVVLEASDEWIAYAAGRPMVEDPGTRFDYNDGVSVLLGKIVREATGARMDGWAAERLFRPIGIDERYWKITPDGEADGEPVVFSAKGYVS